jgi:hypothetical protein
MKLAAQLINIHGIRSFGVEVRTIAKVLGRGQPFARIETEDRGFDAKMVLNALRNQVKRDKAIAASHSKLYK